MPWALRRRMGLLLVACLLAGCGRPPPEPAGEVEAALREAGPGEVFQGLLAGQPVHLVVHDCEVFRVQDAADGGRAWERVLAPEPYPFFTRCERQSLAADAGGVTATLGRMALGAGGCCASGGTYRSADGRNWTKTP
ncbi:hypothetical protein [Paracidovorax cattleyae]|uniref:Lipoprotein n=1 Tax=Paracidovorax cattleyae TaxID=80868 RepID=A0A1H0L101_9BURK|nr:hypothetical protein [Paracidovorax cattleyae]SDO61889.1 hypothetical protein SAMN04489708_10219 [Paracidovorax cattleyae]